MDMQVKWQNKKKDGNFSADGIKTASEWVEEQKNQMREMTEKAENNESSDSTDKDEYKDKILKSINEKLNRGDRLTPSEKRYLQQKDPQAYQKVLDVEREQVFYESQLKRCRTKDEFHKLRMLRTVSSLSTIKSAQSNSSLSQNDKLAIAAGEQQKNAAMERSEKEFIKRGELSGLPTQAECIAAAKKLAEARRSEKKSKEKTVRKKVVQKKPQSVKKKDGKTDKKAAEKVKTVTKTVTVKKKNYTLKRRITRAEAEQSYVVKKVKKAMKRGGIGIYGTALASAGNTVKMLNVKA